MSERHEEKYLIDYTEYTVISNRIRKLLLPDINGKNGRYSVCSLYFDDMFDTALREKEDGNALHIKYRVRTYDGDSSYIRLERKTKRGTVTEKKSAEIDNDELDVILFGGVPDETDGYFGLAAEMRTKALKPKIAVRYDREAYVMPSLGIRVTFDSDIDILPPDKESLFGSDERALPALSGNKVIMEIKYSERCPGFIRKCCAAGMQLSVSKYALARSIL